MRTHGLCKTKFHMNMVEQRLQNENLCIWIEQKEIQADYKPLLPGIEMKSNYNKSWFEQYEFRKPICFYAKKLYLRYSRILNALQYKKLQSKKKKNLKNHRIG